MRNLIEDDDVQLGLELDTVRTGALIVHRFTIPMLPLSKNVYDAMQPSWQHSHKKRWMREVAAKCAEQQIPLDLKYIGLSATLVFPTNRRRDPQNYSATLWNFVPDALQRCGVLQDDRDGRISFGSNLGINLAYDTRPGVPEKHRKRTMVALSYHGAAPASNMKNGSTYVK